MTTLQKGLFSGMLKSVSPPVSMCQTLTKGQVFKPRFMQICPLQPQDPGFNHWLCRGLNLVRPSFLPKLT